MIHADKEKVEIKGNAINIKAELTFIIRGLIQNGIIKNTEDMLMIYNTSKMTEEEIHKEACRILDSMDIGEALRAIMTSRRMFDHE